MQATKPMMLVQLAAMIPFVALPYSVQGAKGNPRVIPPQAKFRGLSYGEWGAEWWTSLFSIPVIDDQHPIISGGSFEGGKGVLFLVGAQGGSEFDITIPPGTPLFFPVVNAECSILEPDPFHGDDEASLRACANGFIDNSSGQFATIDGVPVNDLSSYRVESPLFEFGPLPENNLFDYFGINAPAGTTSSSVDAGIYLLLAPLSVGEHEIHFGGTFDVEPSVVFDTTYHVTVAPVVAVPEPATVILFGLSLLGFIGNGRSIVPAITKRSS
jgi:hypothetical protein